MEISITTVNGKSINLEIDDTSNTIDLKIHGPTRQLVLRLGPEPEPEQEPEPDSDHEEVMRIFVSTLGGKTFNLEVEETETIELVMLKIRGLGGPPVDKQRLIFQGKQLEHGRTIGDYQIKTGSTLVMMSRLCGC